MNEPVEKSSEQSVVSRALALRAKMAADDLYKKYLFGTQEHEESLHIQTADFKGSGFDDWDKGRR